MIKTMKKRKQYEPSHISIIDSNEVVRVLAEDANPINQLEKVNPQQLYTSLAIPSVINTASMGMEYIQKWFFKFIEKDFFRTFMVDGRDALVDFRDWSINRTFKRVKPILSIKSQYNLGFNRDFVDAHLYGINQFMRTSMWNQTFLNDDKNNIYLALTTELFEITYTFSLIVGTRAMQVDLSEYMKMAYRQSSTQGEFIDMDTHVPYDLMLRLANDIGFKIENSRIKDITKFLSYLNSNSSFTFMYKFRGLTGREEFYIRLNNVYAHISNLNDIEIDDGDAVGMTKDNFGINMEVILRIPSPKFYMYFSKKKSETILPDTDETTGIFVNGIYTIYVPELPISNDKGWDLLLSTEYMFEVSDMKDPDRLSINFNDVLNGTSIYDVISYNNKQMISSGVCLDFKLYSDGNIIRYDMNWETLTMKLNPEDVRGQNVFIAIYVDLKYINDTRLNIDNLNRNRCTDGDIRFQK